jgi:hypothetical protein
MIVFFLMYVGAVKQGDLALVPVEAVLTGIGGLAGLYIAGNVADNGVKGKWYHPNLDEKSSNSNGQ